MNLIDTARKGKTNKLIRCVSRAEGISINNLKADISSGYSVIPKNKNRDIEKPCGIGRNLSTKVNVNIGTSPDSEDIKTELKKLKESVKLGADTVMDLSVGKNVRNTRRIILERCQVPLGTVPIYEAAVKSTDDIRGINERDMMKVLLEQAEDGVDFFTIHAGVTKESVKYIAKKKRVIDIVSRGGAILYKWIMLNNRENPFYRHFDEVLDLARTYDITLSLGDGMRPGAIADATDQAQIAELKILGKLQQRALKKGVQTMIEGPGHVPIDQIEKNVRLEKSICHGSPFYVLGPLVTDVAPGYDHITSAIGGALAGSYGADFLCYVTPSEHLRLPTVEDVREGLIASKIAAHAADISKGRKESISRDMAISRARSKRDWPKQFALSIDPEKPKQYRKSSVPKDVDVCTMCGNYCPIKLSEREKGA